MKVTLGLFAGLARHLPAADRPGLRTVVDLPPGATAQDLVDRFRIPPADCAMVLLNGVFLARGALPGAALAEGDTLAIWPPVGGG